MKSKKDLLALLYLPVYYLFFVLLEEHRRFVTIIDGELDEIIPFCEWFVFPYLFWFLFVAWAIVYTAFHDRKDYFRLLTFLYSGMTIFLVVSAVFPNAQLLRPVNFPRDNIAVELCKMVYDSDTCTNVFPSIHVFNAIGVHLFVQHSEDFKERKWSRHIVAIITLLIILSTMFIKQHTIFDVLASVILAVIYWELIYVYGYYIKSDKIRVHHHKKPKHRKNRPA